MNPTNFPTTPQQANQIDMAWIMANVNLDEARRNDAGAPKPRPNRQERCEFVMPPLGTWRLDPFDEFWVLVEIPVDGMHPSEGEWNYALCWPETRLYVQWQREGHEPPPLEVVVNQQGELISCNRRRWLAAREAGIETLKCWYSPTHTEHFTSPKWALRWLGKKPFSYLTRRVSYETDLSFDRWE